MEDTRLQAWYDVAITWNNKASIETNTRGTETIASFETLKQAEKFMNDDAEIKSELQNSESTDMFEFIENVFIDRSFSDSIQEYRDNTFDAIIRTIK